MKSSDSNARRVLLAALLVFASFTIGYLAPHRQAALAQSPQPSPSVPFDNVPGGVGGHGHALITGASTTLIGGKPVTAWPCMKDDRCTLDFQLRFVVPPAVAPAYSCPKNAHCLTFTGKGFQVQSWDSRGKHHPDAGPYVQANVAGMIQLAK